MKKFVIALAGLGNFGIRVLQDWIELAQNLGRAGMMVEFLIAEPDGERRRQALKLLQAAGLLAREFRDWREMLRAVKPDVFHIVLPTSVHCEAICTALTQGIPVVLGEKPWAMTWAELVQIRHARERGSSALLCDFPEKFGGVVLAARTFLEQADLRVTSARALRYNGVGKLILNGSRPGVQGGPLIDKSPHCIANVIVLTGDVTGYRILYSEATRLMETPSGRYLAPNGSLTDDPRAAADAEGRVHLVLERADDSRVGVQLDFGWRNVPAEAQRFVASLNLPRPAIARSYDEDGDPEEDLRLAVIEAANPQGKRAMLVIQTGYRGVEPFALVRQGREQHFLPLPDEKPYAPVLQHTLDVLLGEAVPETPEALLVHEILLDARARQIQRRAPKRPQPAETVWPRAAWA